MITLNLLPDEEKEAKKLEKKMGNVLRFSFSVFFSLVILFAYLLAVQVVLGIELKSARQESAAHSGKTVEETQEAEKMLKSINSISKKINNASEEIPYWSKIFAYLSDICPGGIRLSSIHIEKEHIKISGTSKTREDFLTFQENLKKEGFANLVSPVSNVVSPKDFVFLVEGDVDHKYLNQP